MSDDDESTIHNSVAIIGLSGRMAGFDSVDDLWHGLVTGADGSTTYPDEVLVSAGVPAAELADPAYVRVGFPLTAPGLFAAEFFDMSPAEAEVTDPQHQLFLECCWTALEHAGRVPGGDLGRVGVFAAASASEHLAERVAPSERAARIAHPVQVGVGNDPGMLALRVSYRLNLTGPSLTVSSACSSSLVAVHLACQSLLTHECDMALAGGATVRQLDPAGYRYEEGGILSRDGRCRPFDAEATGPGAGDGVGVVVLKRLADALADGDHVHAVIRGSAVNNDGSTKVGITAPSAVGQAAAIRDALAVAGVDAATIDYVEAHGTGTALGDPIELRALAEALGPRPAGSCRVGAVKASIGHLDAAAGVAGLITTVLAVGHRFMPGTLHLTRLNPAIDLPDSPFRITADGEPWPVTDHPPRAGVSSFGMGGTNAHVVLEAAPARTDQPPNRTVQVLPVAARTADELAAATTRLADHLAATTPGPAGFADVAWTLQVGRARFAHRRAVVATASEAVTALRDASGGTVVAGPPRVVFLLPGQGTRFAGIGARLYASEPVFRAAIRECLAAFDGHLDGDLRGLLLGRGDRPHDGSDDERAAGPSDGPIGRPYHGPDDETAAQTIHAQPAMFCLDYACAQLLLSWGVRPDALLGHSLGELVAACLAGVFDLADAARLVAARARLMQDLPAGRMVAVALGEDELRSVLAGHGTIAAVNAPSSCVVAGDEAEMAEVRRRLAEVGAVRRELPVRRAFHTVHVEPALPAFAEVLRTVRLRPPSVPVLSNLTGTWLTDEQATDPQYWVAQMRGQVRFAAGVDTAAALDNPVFVEVGPGRGLGNLVRAGGFTGPAPAVVSLLASPAGATSPADRPDDGDAEQRGVLTGLAELWCHGVEVDWRAVHGGVPRRRTPLPTYPFTRSRFLLPRVPRTATPAGALGTPVWFSAPPARTAPELSLSGRWLVVAGPTGPAGDVTAALVDAGHPVCRLDPADLPDAQQPADWARLVAERLAGEPVDRVLFAGDVPDDRVDVAVASLAGLTQAVHPDAAGQPVPADAAGRAVHVDVLTEQLREVAGDAVRAPSRAALDGAATVLADRYPRVRFRFLDVGAATTDAERAHRCRRLLAELATRTDDTHLAYRGARRFRRAVVPAPPGGTGVTDGDGFLVVGADQPAGLRIGTELARAGARVVLATVAGHPGVDAARRDELRAAYPGRVSWVTVDLADADGPGRLLATARDLVGGLRGVVQVDAPSGDLAARLAAVRAVADQVGTEVDMLLVTGAAPETAPPARMDASDRLVTEAAACALGALAEQRTAEGRPTTAVRLHPELGWDGPAGALAAVRAALGAAVPQLVVTAPPTVGDPPPQPERAGQPDDPESGGLTDEVEQTVAQVWQEVLGVSGVGPDDDFYQLGGNSLFAMQIVARLRQCFGDLPMSVVFEAPTVGALAAAIRVRQGADIGLDEFEALLREIEADPSITGGDHV